MQTDAPALSSFASLKEISEKRNEAVIDAAEAAEALASALKPEVDKPIKLEDLTDKAQAVIGASQAAAKAARASVTEILTTAQTLVDTIPTTNQIATTISNAELPAKFVQAPPFLFGLFVPPPRWPPRRHTVATFIRAAWLPIAIVVGVVSLCVGLFVVLMVILPLLLPLLLLLLPIALPLLYLYHRRKTETNAAAARAAQEEREAFFSFAEKPTAFFSTSTAASRARRIRAAEAILADVSSRAVGQHPTGFNQHVSSATGLAIYGCGVLAATHVGALRALERHGLNYDKVTTYAGVSAGAVVVAMLAVGCCAEELQTLIQRLDFQALVKPELGSLLRAAANLLLGSFLKRAVDGPSEELLERGNGPGVNSGKVLEDLVGEALRTRTGSSDITLGGVRERYGKRLVLIAAELDSGKERRFTPESDPNLPVRVAVRMSMGIPGAFEPFAYQGHVYCDGGMINDFPITALPDKDHRLGLCVKQKAYVSYNMGSFEEVIGTKQLNSYPKDLREQLCGAQSRLWSEGAYPTRELIDYATSCVNIMMDANLDLQIEMARKAKRRAEFEATLNELPAAHQQRPAEKQLSSPFGREADDFVADEASPTSVPRGAALGASLSSLAAYDSHRGDVFELAPEILTLCSGSLQPFDFALTPEQHHELYLAGQLFTHLYAAHLHDGASTPTLSPEQKLKALLFVLQLGYEKSEPAIVD